MTGPSTVIIGAGLSGLSCAYHLAGDYTLLERETEPGGVVRTTVRHDNFLCDGTGHWLHLRNPEIRELVYHVLNGQLVEYERKAVIHSHGVCTPYPFQANTYGLPREVVLECLLELLKARHPQDFGLQAPAGRPASFGDWIERHFGKGIARNFMIPYNEKLLGVSLDELRPEYAERFIPQPSLEDVVKGAFGFSRESLGYNARFVYPRTGGIGALPRALARSLPTAPRYGCEVAAVDLARRTVTLGTGEKLPYKRLVSTMPLTTFIALCQGVPEEVQTACSRLRATTVHYFDIGVRGIGDEASNHHWIYFPEPEFVFYRAGSYSAVHKEAAPVGCRSYYVEMSGDRYGLLGDGEKLKLRVLEDLKRARVLSERDEVLFMDLCQIPQAYVIFDKNYESSRDTVLNYLAGQGIQSIGRWGGWNYGGMEDAMLDGRRAAKTLQQSEALE